MAWISIKSDKSQLLWYISVIESVSDWGEVGVGVSTIPDIPPPPKSDQLEDQESPVKIFSDHPVP